MKTIKIDINWLREKRDEIAKVVKAIKEKKDVTLDDIEELNRQVGRIDMIQEIMDKANADMENAIQLFINK